ncbi:MAG: right-handed parallel beta-helix repeat-containing protein, partial [Chloroflexota bacterium]
KCTSGQTCCGGTTCQTRKCTPPAPPAPPCMATVCASGCPFTSVNAAYAAAADGDTIFLGPGTYPTGIFVTKDVTLAACPGVTGVKLTPDRAQYAPPTASDSYYAIISEDKTDTSTLRTVTLRGLDLASSASQQDDEALLYSGRHETVSFLVTDCTFTNATYGIWAGVGSHLANGCTFDGCTRPIYLEAYGRSSAMNLSMTGTTVTNSPLILTDSTYGVMFSPGDTATSGSLLMNDCTFSDNGDYGLLFEADTYNQAPYTASITNTTFARSGRACLMYAGSLTFTGCTIEDNGDTGLEIYDASVTVRDTTIQRNTARYWGGGIAILAQSVDASLTIAGTTLITANSAPTSEGCGGIMRSAWYPPLTVAVSGTTTSNVTGNNDGDCKLWTTTANPVTVDCGTWV